MRITTPGGGGGGSSTDPPQLIVATDGTGDYTTIAAALAVVPAGGATVMVKRGTYTLTAALAPAAKTTIRGEGLATIIQAPIGSSLNAVNVATADVTLEDLQIDGLRTSQPNVPGNGSYVGVYVTAARCTIRRCYIHDTRNHGVFVVNGGDDFTIEDSRVENAATSASGIAGYIYPGVQVYGPTVYRPTIRNNYITGWSQAVGLWYGVFDALVEDNRLIANYGYADDAASAAAHTTPRSAIEDYGADNAHGRNRILNNLIDGTTLHCIEIAQGVVGSIYRGNTCKNAGLGPAVTTGKTILIAGQSAQITTDITVEGNYIYSTGTRDDGLIVGTNFIGRTSIAGNYFFDFAYTSGTGALFISSTSIGVSIIGNSFSNCRQMINLSTAPDGVIITGNQGANAPTTAVQPALYLNSGSRHVVSGNTIDTTGNTANGQACCYIQSGSGHRVIGNYFKSGGPGGGDYALYVPTNDNVIERNTLITPYTLGGIGLGGNRNIVRTNYLSGGSRAATLSGTADYNIMQDNQIATGAIVNGGTGTHNVLEPNHTTTVTKPMTLVSLGAKTVNIAQVTIAHGLGYAPTVVTITPTSTGMVWKSAASDATNIYLSASADGTTAEVYVR